MPEELAELLAIDEEGNRLFQALKPGRQRDILYYVNGAKSVQVRIDRAIMMIDRLKKGPRRFS
ncbi:Bacteriocin-protection, YdeI or OmpD-Associated [compost metagenome]